MMKGKTIPTVKKLSQLTTALIMYAAGRVVWVKSSVFRMLVTPPEHRDVSDTT